MNIHDLDHPYPELLFITQKIDQWKRGELPKRWLHDQQRILMSRLLEMADAVEGDEAALD